MVTPILRWEDMEPLQEVVRALRKAGYPQAFIDTFVAEATAGNYDDLLATVMRYVVVK